MSDYRFFLSYAKRDAIGHTFLQRFYNDLALEIGRLEGLGSSVKISEIGFLDQSGIETGEDWPNTLAEALGQSRTLITLYSRGYFNSKYCGKEFQVFKSRLEKYVADASHNINAPPLIIPILWERPNSLPVPLPPACSRIQYTHAEFGEVYAKEGLHFIMRLKKRYHDEYQEFLVRFADKLVREAELNTLPQLEEIPSLEDIESAFHISDQSTVETETDKGGPGVAQFVYVAGRFNEYQGVKRSVDCYGTQGGRDWRPYYPQVNKAIGLISQGVATSQELLYEDLNLSESLIRQIRNAEERNTIVIIVVDPWSIKIQSYNNYMSDYDENMFKNCGVLIPWNETDAETNRYRTDLDSCLKKIFSRNYALNSTYIRDSISSVEELERELASTISDIRGRIIRIAKVFRQVQSDNVAQIPVISGSGKDSV